MPAEENTPTALKEPTISVADSSEFKALNNTQKTAIFMMVLGEEEAADVIAHMPPREVQQLGAAMVSVNNVSQTTVDMVLDEFVVIMKQQTNLSMGTSDYVQRVLTKALGDGKASSVLNRIIPSRAGRGLDMLNWMDARSIAEMIRSEHPQIIAITVSLLEHELAADVLRHFPKELRPDVIMRIANLEIIQPEALEELEVIMKKQFADNSALKSTDVGGVTRAAKIMNFAKAEMESQIMNSLMDADEALTGRIKDNMFIFSNLQSLDARSLQTLIRNIETEKLMIALKGTDDAVKNAFVENMSARGGELFLDDMEASGPVRISDVEEAQKEILLIARRLSDAGEVMLGNGADFV